MWFETKLFGQQVSLVAGKIDLTNYFDSNAVANDETTMFITSAFVNNLALEVPHNGPGAVSIYEMENGLNFRLGLQSADSDNMGLGIGKGFYGIGEVGLHSDSLFGREGNYRLWFKINGDRFPCAKKTAQLLPLVIQKQMMGLKNLQPRYTTVLSLTGTLPLRHYFRPF
ncbi:hypothetical protein KsCSTR_24480 [Candidatus Kuenenia stuttgartiensis]|jgi:hypothetical protein|uniref:Uncharacterized protein n=2 Tax=Candidatus Brocadiaceae TaxID=1127830 RepID=A0A6G7GRK4_KUEST|nr:hypothetical protein [Candidatus Kuenenia stuttgartiensis]QII11827.1 hypothetical protein KsCSTR_24480 [Candidatus Kuenenia stuttgartiensis]